MRFDINKHKAELLSGYSWTVFDCLVTWQQYKFMQTVFYFIYNKQRDKQTNTGSYNCQSITRAYHNKPINSQQYKAFVTWDKTTILCIHTECTDNTKIAFKRFRR